MLQYAVIGAGGFAGRHIRNIRASGPRLGCRLAAVTIRPQDRTPGQVEQFQAEGVTVYAGAVEMFDALVGKVDGVFVPTGIYTHCDLACAALKRGHNVYLEKPPAATVQEVDRIRAVAAKGGRLCALGFQAICSPSVNRVKDRIVSGALGEVQRLRCRAYWPRPDSYYARNEWAGRLRLGGNWVLDGPSNNALAHQIANMLYWASPRPRAFAAPVRVRAELYHARDIESEDTSAIQIATAEGAMAYFIVSHCTSGDHAGPWTEIDCSGGRICWRLSGRTTITYADGRVETIHEDPVQGLAAALENFSDAVRADDPDRLMCNLDMGRNFTLAVNGAFESSRTTHRIPPKHVSRSGQGLEGTYVVDGINDAITRCAAEGELFSDAGCQWGVKTEPFELSGYQQFPRQFAGARQVGSSAK